MEGALNVTTLTTVALPTVIFNLGNFCHIVLMQLTTYGIKSLLK